MPKAKQKSTALTNDGATVGYEARLWQMADALRGSMDAAEYKHVVLGLIFLKLFLTPLRRSTRSSKRSRHRVLIRRTRTSTARSTSSGSTGGALDAPEGPVQATHHWSDRG